MNDRANLNIDVKSDSQTTNIEKTRTLNFVAKVDQLVNADLNERLE
jgi:UDP-3-O-acyl-N-acetylglucosamine deacetylase